MVPVSCMQTDGLNNIDGQTIMFILIYGNFQEPCCVLFYKQKCAVKCYVYLNHFICKTALKNSKVNYEWLEMTMECSKHGKHDKEIKLKSKQTNRQMETYLKLKYTIYIKRWINS